MSVASTWFRTGGFRIPDGTDREDLGAPGGWWQLERLQEAEQAGGAAASARRGGTPEPPAFGDTAPTRPWSSGSRRNR